MPSVADAVSATNASVTTAVAEKAGNAGSPAAVATGNASAPTAAIPTASQSVAAQMTKKVLANGLTVMVMPMRGTGSVSVSGKLRAGGIYSPADKTLVAALTASMLVKGSKNFSKAAVAEALESMGTDLRFAANNFTVAFGTTVVTADLQPLLEMATDLVQNPLFDAEELKRSAKLSAANLMNQMDDPGSMASNRLSQALYSKESIYHDKEYQSLIAELETISADDLRSFHTAHYSPKGAILSVVGDVDADQALALVEKCFGSWTGPEPKPIDDAALFKLGDRLSASSPQKAERISVPMVEKTSVSIVIGVPSLLKRSAPDYFAALLANAALGNDTLSARLGQIVREKHGLTYGIRSVFQDPSYGGAPWLITLDTNPANVEKALKLTAEVTKSYIEGGITDKELADEQGRAAGQFSLRLRNSAGIAQILTDYELIGIGAKAIDSFEQDVRAVTKEQVNAAIRQYLRIDEAVTVLAGTFAD